VLSKSAQRKCSFFLPRSIFIGLIVICSYNASRIVLRSIELGEPIVYVSMNYRCVKLALVLPNYLISLCCQAVRWVVESPIKFLGHPYRIIAFGFLASQEVKDAGVGNLGLHDRASFHPKHGLSRS
jgi:hypothetical protein